MTEAPYRIYRLCEGRDLECIATTPSKEGVGTALVTLAEEGEFEGCTVGVMHRPFDDKPGTWLVNPFPRMGDGVAALSRRRLKGKRKSKPKRKERS